MLDENMQDFHRRLARMSRRPSGKTATPRWRGLPGLRAVLLILATVIAVKVAMLLRLGGAEYEERLAVLRGGEALDRLGAGLLQVDPLTAQVAAWLGGLASGPVG